MKTRTKKTVFLLGVSMLLFATPKFAAVRATEYDDDSAIGFVWDPPDGEFDHYKIYVSENGGAFVFKTTVTTSSYDIPGENDKWYRLAVSAVSVHGTEGPQSVASNTVTCDTMAPTAPYISPSYQIVNNDTAVLTLSQASSDNHFDGYQLFGGLYSQWVNTAEKSSFTYGLLPNQHNTLRIRAIDLAGNLSSNNSMMVNREPLLSTIGSKSATENQLLTFAITANDNDGDPLTYSASDIPNGAGFNPLTSSFSWTPDYDQAGLYQVTFAVSDGFGGTNSEQITVTVSNVNRAPVLDIVEDITVEAGQTVQIIATASDPDGEPVSFSYSGWMTSSTKDTTIDDVGTHTVTVTVSDGDLNDSQQITVTVTDITPGQPGKPQHVES